MALNEEMVSNYLIHARSLKAINNHHVKDSTGNKTGQLPLTIKIGRHWIDEILDRDYEQENGCLTEDEQNALVQLKDALDRRNVKLTQRSSHPRTDDCIYRSPGIFVIVLVFL
ncbi:hypothetical protein [Legionella waltersii]|uniref:Uncharacterized protein n=1 Tax=Legionella waltersii TaxID=66969 RepID=A0A0W1AAG1_9GAMM|nr:hypothetical protein [Legionella waltersii]KTD78313.1 hypothetical protein Lwal_1748 [Legionella waltersii]SNV08762.1 Uncharacterised protein [Legionella waltersii]